MLDSKGKTNSTMKITRQDLCRWEFTAATVEERDLFLKSLKDWNITFPGDLEIKFLYGRMLITMGEKDEGIKLLKSILSVHPEYEKVYEDSSG